MKVPRFLLIATVVTLCALAYVHQQVELLRISYTIDNNRDSLSDLLDQKSSLMYNVAAFQTPRYLESVLARDDEGTWEIPSVWRTVGLTEVVE